MPLCVARSPAYLFALVLAGATLLHAADGWYEISADEVPATAYFASDDVAKGKTYQAQRLEFWFGFLVLELAFWSALLFTPAGKRIAAWASRVSGGRHWLTAALVLTVSLVLVEIVNHPLALGSFLHRRAYGPATQSVASWHLDRLLAAGGSVLITAAGLTVAYVLLRRTPRWWWLLSGVGGSALIVVGMFIYPIWIAPVFNEFEPLEDGPLREKIIALATRCDIDVESIYVMDASRRGSHTNAYFVGVGSSQRIVLYDNLIEEHSDEEVVAVLAHEIGHWKHRHVWRGIALASLGTFALLFIVSRVLRVVARRRACEEWDLALAPVVFLTILIGNTVSMPIQNDQSRRMERQADDEELALTGDPRLLISGMRKMALTNQSDVEPHPIVEWLFYSHPSTMNRIRRAIAEERRQAVP